MPDGSCRTEQFIGSWLPLSVLSSVKWLEDLKVLPLKCLDMFILCGTVIILHVYFDVQSHEISHISGLIKPILFYI